MFRKPWSMSNYRRPRAPGATIFFTVCLAERGSDLLVREVDRLRDAVRLTRAERPFAVDAWVLLPDHMHCVWTLPDGDGDFPTRWGAIKSRFTRSVIGAGHGEEEVGWNPTLRSPGRVGLQPTRRRSPSKVAKGDAGIWQRRYWEHHIRNAADFHDHVRYCWINPIRHGLVEDPGDWPFSSFHRDGPTEIKAGPAPRQCRHSGFR